MKILVINWQDIRNPFGGGAEVHCHEIFKRIVARGHQVVQLSCAFDGAAERENIDGIDIHRIASRNTFNFSVPSAYRRLAAEMHFDLVIDDLNKIPFYTPLYVKEPLLAIAHHFFGTSIYREADPIRATYVWLSEQVANIVYRNTPFAVVSESTRQECIQRGLAANKLYLVRNAIDRTAFPMKIGLKEPVPTISYFSRIKKYKSPDHLLEAFLLLLKDIPAARLWFIGDGDYRPTLEKRVKDAGIDDKVLFHGRVSEIQKVELLSRTWCMVNTSKKEGWGITNIEANACGSPVIAANVPGLRDSVKDGESGLLYQYGDIQALKDCLVQICTNTKYRNDLSEGALRWASTFSWDAEAEAMLNVCKGIIETASELR